jgi:hypothetical protein
MCQPNQDLDASLDDRVALLAPHIRDKTHTAVVVLVARIV